MTKAKPRALWAMVSDAVMAELIEWASVDEMRDRTGLANTQIRRSVARLLQRRVIQCRRRPFAGNGTGPMEYRIR